MKLCGYCGRENDESAHHCRECGTVFEILSPIGQENAGPLASSPLFVDLANVPGAFSFQEGFSRPDWKIISRAVNATVELGQRSLAWEEVLRQWLARLAQELGGGYKLHVSE